MTRPPKQGISATKNLPANQARSRKDSPRSAGALQGLRKVFWDHASAEVVLLDFPVKLGM